MKKLNIKIKPYIDSAYMFQCAEVSMELEKPQLSKGETLASLWKSVAGVPGAEFDEKGLTAADERGCLHLSESIEADPTGFDKKVWKVERATQGDVTLCYCFLPRDVSGIDRCHPYFDTIQEKNGVLICGVTSLIAVPEGTYHIHISWDKSAMPEDATTAAIKGEGDLSFDGTPQDYTFTLYMAGRIKSAQDQSGKYRVHWLADALPDKEKVVEQLPVLVKEMCRFFRDEDLAYSIFFREEPFQISNGGTAFNGGFVYGYSKTMPLAMESALNTLAHEIVHNWPSLSDIKGEGTWYSEGTAEYYSVMIPLWCGIADAAQAADWLTEKSTNYYNNSYQNLTNQEAYDRAWENAEIQRVPYGRGLFYLAQVDYQLRCGSGGKKSVDDLVLELLMRQRGGDTVTVADWEELIKRELGEEAVTEYKEVMTGRKMLEPDDHWFDGLFTFARGTFSDIKKGVIDDALIWKRQ